MPKSTDPQTGRELVRHDPDESEDEILIDGDFRTQFEFRGGLEERHLVWVADDEVAEYRMRGYEVLRKSADGPRLKADPGLKDGEAYRVRELTAMTCDRQKHERRTVAERKANADKRERMHREAQKTIDLHRN